MLKSYPSVPKRTVKLLDHGLVSLINASPFPIDGYGSDYMVVQAARVSLGFNNSDSDSSMPPGLKDLESDKKLIKFLWKNKHLSPFEHITFTFLIKCPIPIARQIQRHRTFSYNEESARYKEVKEEFHVPDLFRKQDKKNKQGSIINNGDSKYVDTYNAQEYQYDIQSINVDAYSQYKSMVDDGVTREQARFVLPQSMYTSFYMTGNLRNWLHFIELRDDSHAQWEVQIYAREIRKIIEEYTPLTTIAITETKKEQQDIIEKAKKYDLLIKNTSDEQKDK